MFGTGDRTYDVVWAYKRKNRAGEFRFKRTVEGLREPRDRGVRAQARR